MVCVGIDIANDKHDCCILDSEGVILVEIAIFSNSILPISPYLRQTLAIYLPVR